MKLLDLMRHLLVSITKPSKSRQRQEQQLDKRRPKKRPPVVGFTYEVK